MELQMKKPELLAPAGDFERLEAAVRFGAGAVYLGGRRFGMRASSLNFSDEELVEAVAFCHRSGVKVYLTCNTTPHNDELEELPRFMWMARQAGVDALIVADIGVFMLARRTVPDMELHISTQAGVTNYLTAAELYHMGASRVVLARELSLAQIAEIRRRTPPELAIEVFVHGAMCMGFSGRCLLSHYLIGRDANRGQCAQPCRWKYHLVEEKRPGVYFPLEGDGDGSYILNARDLCMLEHLDKLAEVGIDSFKIEGRAKSAYYVAVITNAYRMAIERYAADPGHFMLPEWLRDEPRKVSHRTYDTGFFFGTPGQYTENGGYERGWEVAAVVEGWEQGWLRLSQRNLILPGGCFEVLAPGCRPEVLEAPQLRGQDGAALERANHPLMEVWVPCPKPYPKGSLLRRRNAGGQEK